TGSGGNYLSFNRATDSDRHSGANRLDCRGVAIGFKPARLDHRANEYSVTGGQTEKSDYESDRPRGRGCAVGADGCACRRDGDANPPSRGRPSESYATPLGASGGTRIGKPADRPAVHAQ